MPNTFGNSSPTASSPAAVFRKASKGATDASAWSCPKARQACRGAQTSRLSGSPHPVTGQSAQLGNMLAPESELHRIIRPFSRIITSSFANGQQSLDRTCVFRTKIDIRHSFYHPIPTHSHGNIGLPDDGRRTPQCTDRAAASWCFRSSSSRSAVQ